MRALLRGEFCYSAHQRQALARPVNLWRNAMNPPVSSPAIRVVNSVREQVSAEEWQARVDLAACYRLTALYGMTEMVANHISCRVPGRTDQFLINPYGMLYEEIDALRA
jgi:hypothetical protein